MPRHICVLRVGACSYSVLGSDRDSVQAVLLGDAVLITDKFAKSDEQKALVARALIKRLEQK